MKGLLKLMSEMSEMSEFVDHNAKLLSVLRDTQCLSASSVKSKANKRLFQQLEQIHLVQKRRKGAGNQYQLLDVTGLNQFIISQYPSGLYQQSLPDTPRRVQGILARRDSKSFKKLEFDLLTLRGNIPLIYEQKTYPLTGLTSKNTYLSLKVTSATPLILQQQNSTIITIENPTAFTELEMMVQLQWNIAVYTAGKMSNLLLQQLEYWGSQGHNMVHFGDLSFFHCFLNVISNFVSVFLVYCPIPYRRTPFFWFFNGFSLS